MLKKSFVRERDKKERLRQTEIIKVKRLKC